MDGSFHGPVEAIRSLSIPDKSGIVIIAGHPGIDMPAGTLRQSWKQAGIEEKE